jgi:DNA-binding MarR family transcriptional regulator
MTTQQNKTTEQAIHIGSSCACFAVRKMTRAVTQLYDHHLSEAGLRITQFTLKNAISGFGQVPVYVLAEELVMDRTTLTRNLKPLIKAGLVASVPDQKDARVRNLSLTPQGAEHLKTATPYWERAQAEFVEKVGERSWAEVSQGISLIDRALSAGPRPSDRMTASR